MTLIYGTQSGSGIHCGSLIYQCTLQHILQHTSAHCLGLSAPIHYVGFLLSTSKDIWKLQKRFLVPVFSHTQMIKELYFMTEVICGSQMWLFAELPVEISEGPHSRATHVCHFLTPNAFPLQPFLFLGAFSQAVCFVCEHSLA